MKRFHFAILTVFTLLALLVAGCRQEDPGPLQAGTRSFAETDFDRIETSDAMDVTIVQGSSFSINAHGDRRDLDDMHVVKHGSTLSIKFDKGRNRQYTTYIEITMPKVNGVKFSGAVTGRATGFDQSTGRFDLNLSGASTGRFELQADELMISLSGASTVEFFGSGKKIDADVSGASKLIAFDYPVNEAKIVVSGASHAKVQATQQLVVNASGASEVRYRGKPQVDARVSGASWVGED